MVVYDQLVNPVILEEFRRRRKGFSSANKRGAIASPRKRSTEVLIDYARLGYEVVRLKGGDPFVFGRGGEEAEALADAGIPFEIVPGVSSAVAVPAYAGIPLTHRKFASSFAVVTGHEAESRNLRGLGQAGDGGGHAGDSYGLAQSADDRAKLIAHGRRRKLRWR